MGDNNKAKEEETTSSNGELLVVVTEEAEAEEDAAAWGTLEELLLVCAVNRHGSKSWDSVATELRQRRRFHSHFAVEEPFSADDCRRKYVDLRRRYNAAADKTFSGAGDGEERKVVNSGGDGEREEEDKVLRMVDELRKLRVEQLKREVHKHDVSIVSLQKKVKRLEEDRGENKKKNNSSTSSSLLVKPEIDKLEPKPEPSDLRIEPDSNANKTDSPERSSPERSSPEKQRGGDSAEDRSVNESNSSKAENNAAEPKPEPNAIQDPAQTKTSRLGESASESKRDDSYYNNNNNNITSTKLLQQQQQEQSSDVQSSASLSKKKRRRFRVGGNSSGDEIEAEEISPANKRISVKSQPLIRFLDLLRSHKHGSVFHRRLPSQETEKFRNVVRQHMDLDTVQSRLERGVYSECHPKFYRDLILIFTNAVLFYRKSSAEHIAARELRKLVVDEIALRVLKPKPQPTKPDPEPQHLEPVVKKPRSATTMVVCRRRSSIQGLSESMKKKEEPLIVVSGGGKKDSNGSNNTKVANGREDKSKNNVQHQKKVDVSSLSANDFTNRREKEDEVENSKKLLTKERSTLGGRGTLRLSNNNGKKVVSKDGNNNKREKMGSSEGEGDDATEKRKVNVELKQEKVATTVLKKQGVANFLKRMKQNSPSSQEKAKNSNDSDDEEREDGNEVGRKGKIDYNNSNSNSGKKTGANVRKNIATTKDVDVVVTRRSSGRRGEKEAVASRRAIGRPPKRKAAMMGSGGGTPDSSKGGRSGGRDVGEKAKKRARR